MKWLKLTIVIICLGLMSVGCSKLNKSDEYKNALPHDKTLALPKNISSTVVENHYPIPEIQNNSNSANVSVIPPGSKL